MKTIGERIKYLRTIKQITQEELAEKTNISRGNLSNYEKNRFKPASDSIVILANFFNVSTDWLLTGKSQQTPGITRTAETETTLQHTLRAMTDQDKRDIQLFMEFLQYKRQSMSNEE